MEWFSGNVVVPPVDEAHDVRPEKAPPAFTHPPVLHGETEARTITVYFSDGDAMYLKPEQRTLDDSGLSQVEMVIGELIEGPLDERLVKTVPANARLLRVWLDGEVAYVDFSREFQTEHWGGSAGDTFTLYSIVNSLTELAGINAVQFLVEGEVQEAVLGHTDTTQPITRREDLIGEE